MRFKITLIMIIFSLLYYELPSETVKTSPTTREMNLITWTEFAEWVPGKIDTVLLPVGSIEPHGVIPNGTDNLAPTLMANEIAPRLNALIAPTLNYGITPAMKAFPGAITISESAYLEFIKDILHGLADNRFKNIIILNGHGGNTALLQKGAVDISTACRVRILVVNWWSLTSEEIQEVFGQDGGHAGNNETAYIQAVYPEHIHPERYTKEMAMANPAAGAWYAVPVTSSIGLYKEGQGYPTFDPKQARQYYKKVNDKVAALIETVIKKWDQARLYR